MNPLDPTPPTAPDAQAAGADLAERRKLQGMEVAAVRKQDLIAAAQLAFLDALCGSPDGAGTLDDATADLANRFHDGGKWRGTVTRQLALEGLIVRLDMVPSARPARHRGYLTRWGAGDRAAIDAKRAELRHRLGLPELPPAPAPVGTGGLFDPPPKEKGGAGTPAGE